MPDNSLSALGFGPEDYAKYQQMSPYMQPIVSPWLSLGAGALMGLYSQSEQEKQRKKDIALNAKLALTKRFTGTPNQTRHVAPSLMGNVLGGIGTALGTAKSINEYSAAKNIHDKIQANKLALSNANNPFETPAFVGPPTADQMQGAGTFSNEAISPNDPRFSWYAASNPYMNMEMVGPPSAGQMGAEVYDNPLLNPNFRGPPTAQQAGYEFAPPPPQMRMY